MEEITQDYGLIIARWYHYGMSWIGRLRYRWWRIVGHWRMNNYYKSLGYTPSCGKHGWLAPDGHYCNIIPDNAETTWSGRTKVSRETTDLSQ